MNEEKIFNQQDPLQSLNVLYVENDEDIRGNLSKYLRRRVGNLVLAENGVEGLEKFKEFSPDVVVTDIRMQDMDGLQMAAKIRELDEEVRILIITGHNDEEFFLRAIELNVDRYFKKPLDNKKLVSTLTRIAQNIENHRQIENKNRFIANILNAYPGFLMITDGQSISYMNHSFLSFLGHDPKVDVSGHNIDIDRHLLEKEHSFYKGKKFQEWSHEMIRRPEFDYVIHMKEDPQQESDDANVYLARLSHLDCFETGEYLISFTDITLMETIRELFHELAIKDPLTKAFNRKKFYEELEREMSRAQRYDEPLSLVMFDLDHFKEVNDQFGHQVGDRVLVEVVGEIRKLVRRHDVLGRYGGEEFTIFLPQTKMEDAFCISNRIREQLGKHDYELPRAITASFGVAQYVNGESIDEFIKRVDSALYEAKDAGRNRVMKAEN